MCGAEGPLCPCQVLCGGGFPLWGRGDRLLSCRTAGFRVRGRGDRSGKRDVAAGSADPGADGAIRSKGPVPPESVFFGRIHTVLRGIGTVSERYVTLNLKRYRAFSL